MEKRCSKWSFIVFISLCSVDWWRLLPFEHLKLSFLEKVFALRENGKQWCLLYYFYYFLIFSPSSPPFCSKAHQTLPCISKEIAHK